MRSILISLALAVYMVDGASQVLAQAGDNDAQPSVLIEEPQGLVVPVYPKGHSLNTKRPATVDDLHGFYITMSDGSVLSLAQWVIEGNRGSVLDGPLNRGQMDRLLGQTARAAMGQGPVTATRLPLPAPYAVIPKPVPLAKGFRGQAQQAALMLANLFGGQFGEKPLGPQVPAGPEPIKDGSGVIAGHYEQSLGQHQADQQSVSLSKQLKN